MIPPFPEHALDEGYRRDAPEPSSDTRLVWEPGEHLLDQYKIEKDLGSGGKGARLSCSQCAHGRTLRREEDSPNSGAQIVIFVEYMDGNSLKEWIKDAL